MSHYFTNDYMELALLEAKKAAEKGEVPVGCVIVNYRTKEIIAKAHNLVEYYQNPLAHAEINAIKQACQQTQSKNLANHALYVTLEPCNLCSTAISFARLDRLYYAARDQKNGSVEHGNKFFQSTLCRHRPEIYAGNLETAAESILKNFFKKLR